MSNYRIAFWECSVVIQCTLTIVGVVVFIICILNANKLQF